MLTLVGLVAVVVPPAGVGTGGTFTALSINDGTIEDVTFDTAPSTFAKISASATDAHLAVSAADVLTLNQTLTTQSAGTIDLAATNGITLTADVALDTSGAGTTPAGAAITLGAVAMPPPSVPVVATASRPLTDPRRETLCGAFEAVLATAGPPVSLAPRRDRMHARAERE